MTLDSVRSCCVLSAEGSPSRLLSSARCRDAILSSRVRMNAMIKTAMRRGTGWRTKSNVSSPQPLSIRKTPSRPPWGNINMACDGCSTGNGILLDIYLGFRVADDSTSGNVASATGAGARNIISIFPMTNSSTLLRCLTKPAVLGAVFFLLSCGIRGWAQSADQSTPPLPGAQRSHDEDAWEAQQKREMAKKENVKRQQDLEKETDKLLELATELKQYVDKTNENTLSVEVIKKAEEIEKLAHSVKEKMKQY